MSNSVDALARCTAFVALLRILDCRFQGNDSIVVITLTLALSLRERGHSTYK